MHFFPFANHTILSKVPRLQDCIMKGNKLSLEMNCNDTTINLQPEQMTGQCSSILYNDHANKENLFMTSGHEANNKVLNWVGLSLKPYLSGWPQIGVVCYFRKTMPNSLLNTDTTKTLQSWKHSVKLLFTPANGIARRDVKHLSFVGAWLCCASAPFPSMIWKQPKHHENKLCQSNEASFTNFNPLGISLPISQSTHGGILLPPPGITPNGKRRGTCTCINCLQNRVLSTPSNLAVCSLNF